MTKPYLRDHRADAVEFLKEHGQWIVAGINTDVPWPKEAQVVPFKGLDFILRPQTKDHAPTICLNASKAGITAKDGRDLIMQFGSALAFSEGQGFEVHTWIGGSSAVFIGRGQGHVIQEFLEPEYLPIIPDEDCATAIALYREGLSSVSNFYAFLNLYKVLSFIHREGKKRGEWIDAALSKLTDARAKERLAELQKDGIAPGEYLRDSGRHAITHSEKDEFVNPDKMMDHERIYRDLPIMRALARKAIEERFQIYPRIASNAPQQSDIPGFERIFGLDLIEKLLKREAIENTILQLPADITALVRRRNKFLTLTGLFIDHIWPWGDGSAFKLTNREETLYLACFIDFRNHKLVYEPQGNSGTKLNKASRASVEEYISLCNFNKLYFGNGRLELWDNDTDELLGMTEMYLPKNMLFDIDLDKQEQAQLQQLLDAATED